MIKLLAASRTAAALCLVLLAQTFASAQGPDPTRQRVVYKHPDADKVAVRQDVTYKTVGATALKMDVYTPPAAKAGDRLPVVIFVNAFGDPPGRAKVKTWGQYTDWPRLVAAAGMVGVTYEARADSSSSYHDLASLIDYVRSNASDLGVDSDRVGLWSCSGNVLMGLPVAMDETRRYIRAAVFYYGVMTEHPARNDVPMFVARAGDDDPQLNGSIDVFMKAAVEEEAPVTFVNYVGAQHAFDLVDDTERTREVIRQTIDFLKFNLTRNYEAEDAARRVLSPPRFMTMIQRQGIQKALQEFEASRKLKPDAALFREDTLNNLGYRLLQQGKAKEAVEVFKLNVAAYPNSANAYDSLGDGYEADGQKELAVRMSEKALQTLAAQTGLSDEQKNNIRTSAEAKLKRLKQN
jgi:tetratricopeptide (TPR) repeat protein